MQHLPTFDDPDLLVGPEHFSDAGVYRIADGLAVVQTLDFFPPLVDDPYLFGQIAAANSLSDVYAMGGRPKTALNVVAFPDNQLPISVLQEILRGGAERVAAAGAVILGGHSVRSDEIMYGLSVTGIVDPSSMMTNARAKPGDMLVLTKALGTGFVTTANRAGECPADVLADACAGMVQLNADAAAAAISLRASAVTDITGFGLAGHGIELARASGVSLTIELNRLPLLTGAKALAVAGFFTRANAATRGFHESAIRFEEGIDSIQSEFLFDPQTSGGLLVSIDAGRADEFVQRCRQEGAGATTIVGSVGEQRDDVLHIVP